MMFLRYGLIFLGMAMAAFVGAYLNSVRWLQIVLACCGVAFLVVAVAYLGLGPGVFLKGRDGRLHPASYLWLWPFFLLNGLIFNVYHRLSGAAAYAEILPGLYLGRRLWEGEARKLGACGVLDLTCELRENRVMRGRERYLCLPVLDNTCPTPEQLRRGAAWLGEALAEGPVYVHCAAGHGRSATLVAAYLLATGRAASVEAAIAMLKARRPGVHINACQRASLERFIQEASADRRTDEAPHQ